MTDFHDMVDSVFHHNQRRFHHDFDLHHSKWVLRHNKKIQRKAFMNERFNITFANIRFTVTRGTVAR